MCVRKLCVCVSKLYGEKLCVSKLWAAGRAGGADVHNQKQEPHTKMWGVTIIITDLTKKRRKKIPLYMTSVQNVVQLGPTWE